MTGDQEPRLCHVPAYDFTVGDEAVELSATAGLVLDPWQQFVLRHALGRTKDGKWAAFEVGVVVPRQNGKGAILEARSLAGLYLLGERLIIHSAHQFDTSLEAFRRLLWLIEDTPDLDRQVKRVSRSHGEEGIELKSGSRIRFRTRTKGGGRGFASDCLLLDEAMILPESSHGALLPTLSARPNPQAWYTGSAVDQLVHADGVVFARIRERGIRAEDPALAFFEWSCDFAKPHEAIDHADDPRLWAHANPGFGIRIAPAHVANEQRSMDPRTFATERLNVGDWPRTDGHRDSMISSELWAALVDEESEMLDPIVLAFDVNPSRSRTSIVAAGIRSDGLYHLEVIEHRAGTGWVTAMLGQLVEKHEPDAVLCDSVGPAASLIPELDAAGIPVTALKESEIKRACGFIFDACERRDLRHLGQPELAAAIKGGVSRPLGDAWAWSRKHSGIDISPLVASTIALWRVQEIGSVYDARGMVAV